MPTPASRRQRLEFFEVSNFRLILKWLKVLLRLILAAILDSLTARPAVQSAS